MSVPLGRPHLCAGHSASPRSGSASGNWRPALASDSGRGISGSEGRRVSHSNSPVRQGRALTWESGRLRALRHTPSSGRGAEPPGAVFPEGRQCPRRMSHRAVAFLTGAIWVRVSGIVNTLLVCQVRPIIPIFFFPNLKYFPSVSIPPLKG